MTLDNSEDITINDFQDLRRFLIKWSKYCNLCEGVVTFDKPMFDSIPKKFKSIITVKCLKYVDDPDNSGFTTVASVMKYAWLKWFIIKARRMMVPFVQFAADSSGFQFTEDKLGIYLNYVMTDYLKDPELLAFARSLKEPKIEPVKCMTLVRMFIKLICFFLSDPKRIEPLVKVQDILESPFLFDFRAGIVLVAAKLDDNKHSCFISYDKLDFCLKKFNSALDGGNFDLGITKQQLLKSSLCFSEIFVNRIMQEFGKKKDKKSRVKKNILRLEFYDFMIVLISLIHADVPRCQQLLFHLLDVEDRGRLTSEVLLEHVKSLRKQMLDSNWNSHDLSLVDPNETGIEGNREWERMFFENSAHITDMNKGRRENREQLIHSTVNCLLDLVCSGNSREVSLKQVIDAKENGSIFLLVLIEPRSLMMFDPNPEPEEDDEDDDDDQHE